MPYAVSRICRRVGCHELHRNKDGLCEQHRKDDHKRYNREKRPEFHKMYRTPRWRSLRDAHIEVQPFCERCDRIAALVHHRAPHMGDAALFFNANNLESLCVVCHNKEHRRGATA